MFTLADEADFTYAVNRLQYIRELGCQAKACFSPVFPRQDEMSRPVWWSELAQLMLGTPGLEEVKYSLQLHQCVFGNKRGV